MQGTMYLLNQIGEALAQTNAELGRVHHENGRVTENDELRKKVRTP
jgi:hypothetical protein